MPAGESLPPLPAMPLLLDAHQGFAIYLFIHTHGAVSYSLTPLVRLCWRAQGVSTTPSMQ